MASHDGDEGMHGATLAQLLAAAQRRWGAHILRQGASPAGAPPALPTGYAPLEQLLGGGFPRGSLTELRGARTSGMTTIALTALAQTQARGDLVAYVDVSATFDAGYAAACGVRLTDLLLVRPQSAFEALELVEALLGSGGIGTLVVDSLARIAAAPGTALDACVWGGSEAAAPHTLIPEAEGPGAPTTGG